MQNVSAIGRAKPPRVSITQRSGAYGGSDATEEARGGGSTKNPEGLAGGIVLAGIDMDEQLRLALLEGNKRKRRDEQGR